MRPPPFPLPSRRTLLAGACMATLLAAGLGPASSWAQGAPAQAMDVSGVHFPASVTVDGKPLRLNGAGTRYKLVFKVYAAGLYLGAPARSADAVFATPGPKRLQVAMLREIDANELGKLFVKGMQENASREEAMKAMQGTLQMGELFANRKRLKVGETFSVDYLPGRGTVILINDRQEFGPVPEPEFYSALMKIWLGRAPADFKLKDALLGDVVAASN